MLARVVLTASGSQLDRVSIEGLRSQKAILEGVKQDRRTAIGLLRKQIRQTMESSYGFQREIHDRAMEIEASKLVVSRVTRCALLVWNERLM